MTQPCRATKHTAATNGSRRWYDAHRSMMASYLTIAWHQNVRSSVTASPVWSFGPRATVGRDQQRTGVVGHTFLTWDLSPIPSPRERRILRTDAPDFQP